jgi:hypothetical protein
MLFRRKMWKIDFTMMAPAHVAPKRLEYSSQALLST